jgi:hypothetical protein
MSGPDHDAQHVVALGGRPIGFADSHGSWLRWLA